VVAHLLRLKLTLLRNSLRRDVWRLVATVLGLVWALGSAAFVVVGIVLLRGADPQLAGSLVSVAGALLVAGWVVVPVIAFGVDETLDPARFATFALRRRDLVPGLLLAGVVGVPGLVTVLLALATVVTWTRGVLPALVALVGAVLAAVTCVAASRAATSAAAGLLASRRVREVAASVGILAMILVGPLPSLLGRGFSFSGDDLLPVARVAGWTPLGWTWSAPWDAAEGRFGAAVVKLALAGVLLAGLVWAWAVAMERALVRPHSGPRSRVRGGGLLDRLPLGPVGAVTARCLRYWRRDPRYATSLVATVAILLSLGVLVLVEVLSLATAALVAAPVIAGLTGWGQHNDVAYDGTAIWMHVAAGVPGRADRWGRFLAVLTWSLPVVLLIAVAGAGVAGRWELLPAVLGLAVALFGVGSGVSAVTSVVMPYPVPEAGANPFSQPAGAGMRTMIAQMVTSGVTVLLTLPVLITFVLALRGGSPLWMWLTLVLGAGTGVAALLFGMRQGGRLFEARGPELLLALRR
jgi:ABC-2 type transport system permease protein